MLDQFLMPATNVRMILTCRTGAPDWDVASIDVGGLSDDDAMALFDSSLTHDEKVAVRGFVSRCGGHPMVVRAVANAVRYHPGPLTDANFGDLVRTAATTVTDAVTGDLARVSERARDVLRVAAVLAPAPFPSSLVAKVLGAAGERLDATVEHLVRLGLMQVVGTEWEVHALFSQTVRADVDLRDLADLAAATLLDDDRWTGSRRFEHARVLGLREDLAAERRIRLLRQVVEHYDTQGDPVTAAQTIDTVLSIERRIPDLLSAARLAIAGGHPRDAEHHAREVIELATATDDYRARDRARLRLAQALDQLGRLDEADDAFWVTAERGTPGWMDIEERISTSLALAAAKLLRGRPNDVLEIV